jgi:Flp pilus assembly protein TadG
LKQYRKLAKQLRIDETGASAVELAIMLPVLMLFSFSILEFSVAIGRYLQVNEAARSGARVAAIQPAIANLDSLQAVPAVCSGSSSSVSCNGYSVNSSSSFSAVVAEIQRIVPDISSDQVEVSYSSSGTGFSTTADGSAPLVTVRIIGYEHQLLLQNLTPGINSIQFPDFATSRITSY